MIGNIKHKNKYIFCDIVKLWFYDIIFKKLCEYINFKMIDGMINKENMDEYVQKSGIELVLVI